MDENLTPEQDGGDLVEQSAGDAVAVSFDEQPFVPEQPEQQPEPVAEYVDQSASEQQLVSYDTQQPDQQPEQPEQFIDAAPESAPEPQPVSDEPSRGDLFGAPAEQFTVELPEQQPAQPEPVSEPQFQFDQVFAFDQPGRVEPTPTLIQPVTMEVWNEEAPNAHTTVDDYFDESQYNVPAEEETPVVNDPNLDPNVGQLDVMPEVKPDEFGDVYASDGTYIGNVFLNEDLTKPATEVADNVHVDQTTGDLVDENGNVIGSAYDNGSIITLGGNQNQPSGPDLIVDSQGDLYDKDGNYLGNSADAFIDEYGNVFDAKGNFVGTTNPANANFSSASQAMTPNTPGSILPRGGSGGAGGGAGGSGGGTGGSGSGTSITPKSTPPASSTSTPGKTAARVLVQQQKSGTSLVKIYSDGSREVIANYFAPAITTPTQVIEDVGVPRSVSPQPSVVRNLKVTQPPANVVTRNTGTMTGLGGLSGSITGTPTSNNDFFAALFGNAARGLTGPGSGSVSYKGYNPGTQLTPSGQPRVSGGRSAGSTAPTSTVNSMVAGSRPGQQGKANLTPPAEPDLAGGALSSGAGGLAALAIGAVALFAVAS